MLRGRLMSITIALGLASAASPCTAQAGDESVSGSAASVSATRETLGPRAADRTRTRLSTGRDRLEPGWSSLIILLGGCAVLMAAGQLAKRWKPGSALASAQIIGRVPLSPKHTLFVVEIGDRRLLVGAGPQGPPALITELDAGGIPAQPARNTAPVPPGLSETRS